MLLGLREELVHQVVLLAILPHPLGDPVDGVVHGGVVAPAERAPDRRQRRRRQLAAEVHRDLPRVHEDLRPPGGAEVGLAHTEGLAHELLDSLDGDGRVPGIEVVQHLARELERDRPPRQRREREHPCQRALELADVRGHAAGDLRLHLEIDRGAGAPEALSEDRDPCLEIGRLDVGDEPPLEARAKPFLTQGRVGRAARELGDRRLAALRSLDRPRLHVPDFAAGPGDGGVHGRVRAARTVGGALWIGVWHPFVSGRLSRWLRIEKMIEYMLGTGEVWFARLEDIARHVLALRQRGEYDIRLDRLPYYERPQLPNPPPSPMTRASK